ncbi:hypothetical protein [Rahnella perminowiae]|uniref:hypothetical protein n=1 Tax=Rahnella perminowiae TaxID=2816244 RepID=UPI00215CD1D9|nr:hypothetical protein [Rahnella perminowiae]MCR9003097.1 hypothetical protein [Rahnella perminowiae]
MSSARDWLYDLLPRVRVRRSIAAGESATYADPQDGNWAEVNLISLPDIDMSFAYPENGQTRGGRRELDNAQFFTRLESGV